MRCVRWLLVGIILMAAPAGGRAADSPGAWQERLEALSAIACRELPKPRRDAFYRDSYAVRGLCVAYDVTGKRPYLDACMAWSDQMLQHQSQMTPKGAYYMNYGRKPGEQEGSWYVADSASIALAVLATAVRCREAGNEAAYARYLDSVKAYAGLTIDNYVGPGGGITDGLWPKFDGEWWCSSGIFASTALMLYAETGDESYRRVGLGAIDWLNRLEIPKAQYISFEEAAPSVIMYVLEGYSTAMPCLEPGSDRYKQAMAQWDVTLDWMEKNQPSRNPAGRWKFDSQWGSKLGGLPFHMYVYARTVPGSEEIVRAADGELAAAVKYVLEDKQPGLSQAAAFTLLSLAEKVRPGAVYRATRR